MRVVDVLVLAGCVYKRKFVGGSDVVHSACSERVLHSKYVSACV